MERKIIWSPNAKISFDNLIEFLETKWEKKVIQKLFLDLNSTLLSISNNPEMFSLVSAQQKLRKCVLRRKTLMLYRVKSKNIIELVIFADARQNPKKYKI